MHVDDASWHRLWKDPASARELLEHLREGCETCDDFLAARPELDGAVDRLLLSLAPPRAVPLDELGWRRLIAKLKKPSSTPRVLLAVAAGLVLLGGTALVLRDVRTTEPEPTAPGVKGPAKLVLEVVAARRTPAGAFEQLRSGDRVAKGSLLAFQVSSPVEGPARVFIQRGREAPEELAQLLIRSGVHQLEQDTGLFGVALEDERGAVTVWVVAAEAPFDVNDAVKAITSGTPSLAVGRVEVLVDQ